MFKNVITLLSYMIIYKYLIFLGLVRVFRFLKTGQPHDCEAGGQF